MSKPAAAIASAKAYSPFLAGLIDRQPELTALLEQGQFDAALLRALSLQGPDTAASLRKQRQGVALITAVADLSGIWDLTKVTRVLSDFADSALNIAIETAIRERYDTAPIGFAIIALGKHGGRELNYSSDIDPIFIYDPNILPRKDNEDPQEAAVRIGRRVIDLLGTRDENGYVFRVDMRLRPTPEVSPIALPVNGAISYYESSALAWEQAAFIRSRAAAGDKVLGQYFLDSIKSFIWRKNLDFGQLANIQRMSAQIRDHYAKGQVFGPGYDLKRGRGGIRECEFFGQAHQLIHGGRKPVLRVADTRGALALLAEEGAINGADADGLIAAYETLRQWEHRLQMVDDRQTHSLPETQNVLDQVARLGGLADGSALLAALLPVVEQVAAIYDSLAQQGAGDTPKLAEGNLPLEDQLSDMGFADASDPTRRIERWRSGRIRAIRTPSAVTAFEEVLPAIMQALAMAPDPPRALARFDNVIERLPSAVNFFHLLAARPALLQLLADIFSYAPVLADALAVKVDLLDRLIDATALELPGDTDALQGVLGEKCANLPYELQLDAVRDFVGEQRFALGVQLIEGQQDPLAIARSYAHLAEAALAVLSQATITEFEAVHGQVPGGEILILALGRLGGGALTHASDLDLVYLFTGSFDVESNGTRPLGASQYFNRLGQRITAAMSVATASGALYEVDTRLRPSGNQGPLAVSLDSFARYQRAEAWSWEHMALCRARPVYGSIAGRDALQRILDQALTAPRDGAKLRIDAISMRRDMARHKPPRGALDVKLLPGGLVDLEFTLHYLQLTTGKGLYPGLEAAIQALITQGILPVDVLDAYHLLGRLLVILRLVCPDCVEPSKAAEQLISRSLGQESWQATLHAIERALGVIQAAWDAHLG